MARFASFTGIIPIVFLLLFTSQCKATGLPLPGNRSTNIPISDGDLVIGDDYPDETLIIKDTFDFQGNIRIINHGSLIILGNDAALNLAGNVFVQDQGHFEVNAGKFTLLQNHLYQYSYNASDNGAVLFIQATLSYSNLPASGNFTDATQLLFQETESDEICTIGMSGTATLDVEDSVNSVELIALDQIDVRIRNSDFFLLWLGFAAGDVATYSFPDATGTVNWDFSSDLPGVSGVGYRIHIENCTNVNFAVLSWPGSDVTLLDSSARACGVYISASAPQQIQGVVNGQLYNDFTFPLTDRVLHFLNTSIATWNLYSGGNQFLSVRNCILGEVISFDDSECSLMNCLIDGTGGHVGAEDNAGISGLFTTVRADIIATDNATMHFLYSSQVLGRFICAAQSGTVWFNHLSANDPDMFDQAVLIDTAIVQPEWEAPLNCTVPIVGSARVLTGPEQPVHFDTYFLEYGSGSAPETWIPIGEFHEIPVKNGILENWDTGELEAGVYTLKLTVNCDVGDPVSVTKVIHLGVLPTYTPFPTPTPQNSPSPTPSPTPAQNFTLQILLNQTDYTAGDRFELKLQTSNPGADTLVDVYLILNIAGSYWFWDDWTESPDFQYRTVPAHCTITETILDFVFPPGAGSNHGIFYAGAVSHGTDNLVSNLSEVVFYWS